MKNHPIIIALLLMLLTLTTCHKDKEFDMKEAVVSNEEVIVLETQARFSWEVDFEGHFQTGVEVSPNENMAEARRVEAMKEDEGFAVVVDSLSMGTKYYYSIVVWNKFGRYEHLMGDFTTKMSYTILVSADEGGTVTGGGTYIAGDTCTVVATANAGYNFVNWTENGEQVSSEEEYTFIVTDDRDLVANFTSQQYTITATANPTDGGSVTGGGTYYEGAQCTVTAIPADGYTFTTWYEVYLDEGGVSFEPVSTDASYTFTVNSDRTLEANFSVQAPNTYNIDVYANPTDGGTVSGGGTYQQGQQCTVTATSNDGYTFTNWTENGNVVSTNANYTFNVTGNRTLVANFTDATGTGVLNGVFSVGENSHVNFSQGNLQYQASTDTWRFATNQFDYVGSDNSNISQTYSGWIDLFGWGTSGYNHGANCYQPWSTSKTNSDYYAYGSYTYNLYDQTGQADWGYNAISNGGNQTNQWRTLTQPEWNYVFNTRTTTSGIRYAMARVNNVNGVILLPDDWSSGTYSLSNTNSSGASFSSNTLTASQWSTLEQAGAVFLPAAGFRNGAFVGGSRSYRGYYWSASYSDSGGAYLVSFNGSNLLTNDIDYRYFGQSVRLVRVAE